jgi:hypothetical protein
VIYGVGFFLVASNAIAITITARLEPTIDKATNVAAIRNIFPVVFAS